MRPPPRPASRGPSPGVGDIQLPADDGEDAEVAQATAAALTLSLSPSLSLALTRHPCRS